jgi:hypothetical protein
MLCHELGANQGWGIHSIKCHWVDIWTFMAAAGAIVGADIVKVLVPIVGSWAKPARRLVMRRHSMQFIIVPFVLMGMAVLALVDEAIDFWGRSPAMEWDIFQIRRMMVAYLWFHLSCLLVQWFYRNTDNVD